LFFTRLRFDILATNEAQGRRPVCLVAWTIDRGFRAPVSGYGLFAASIRDYVISRPRILMRMRRTFAAAFVALGAKLAFADR
jgi:threonine/homoserine/homoserine lactone efflux protein